ncbi:hypothetical protein lerEdw1_013497 [Lerista edwardsae]|nr:hypothetical protein lerEdw1_013497 [Lerista edwardsae]
MLSGVPAERLRMPAPEPERCKASHFLFRFPGKASFEFPTRGAGWEGGGAEPEPDLDLPGGGHQCNPFCPCLPYEEAWRQQKKKYG